VHVAHQVVGFKKIRFFTSENVGSGELNLPVQEMHTTSFWMTISNERFAELPFNSIDRLNGLHGLAYIVAQLSSVFLMCDRRDLGATVETGTDNPMFDPTIFIYDNYPAGIGLSRPLYEIRDQVLAAAADLIRACGCEEGCPSCVGTVSNGSNTKDERSECKPGRAQPTKEVTLVLLKLFQHA
jgi:DEAD/DEAH box helicase domain-containing protein